MQKWLEQLEDTIKIVNTRQEDIRSDRMVQLKQLSSL